MKKLSVMSTLLILMLGVNCVAQNMVIVPCINMINASLLGSQINVQPTAVRDISRIGDITDPMKIDLVRIGVNCAKQGRGVFVSGNSPYFQMQYGVPGVGYSNQVGIVMTQSGSVSRADIANPQPEGMGICRVIGANCNNRLVSSYPLGSTIYLVDNSNTVPNVGVPS